MGTLIRAGDSANKLRIALATDGNAYRAAATPTLRGRPAAAEQVAIARKGHRPASDCLAVVFLLAPIVLALVFPLSLVMGVPFAAITVLCMVIAFWRGIPLGSW
jgi:hypothetical protein